MGFPAAQAASALAAAGHDVQEAIELIMAGAVPAAAAAAAPRAAESVDLSVDLSGSTSEDDDPSAPAAAEQPKPAAAEKPKPKPAASPVLQRGAASPAKAKRSSATGKGKPVDRVEEAGSGRAGCKSCKVKIQKAELRVGTTVTTQWGEGMGWWHAECFPFGNVDAASLPGYSSLPDAAQQQILNALAHRLRGPRSSGPPPLRISYHLAAPFFCHFFTKDRSFCGNIG
jgi:hypothetical protein